jgi:hypothetical protein
MSLLKISLLVFEINPNIKRNIDPVIGRLGHIDKFFFGKKQSVFSTKKIEN